MKYKVGQKVRVREDLEEGKNYSMFYSKGCNTVTIAMQKLSGRVVTIRSYDSGQYLIQEMGFFWTDEMFEDVELENLKHRLIGKEIMSLEQVEGCQGLAESIVGLDDGEMYQISLPFGFKIGTECYKIIKLKRDFMEGKEVVVAHVSNNHCVVFPLAK